MQSNFKHVPVRNCNIKLGLGQEQASQVKVLLNTHRGPGTRWAKKGRTMSGNLRRAGEQNRGLLKDKTDEQCVYSSMRAVEHALQQ